MKRLVVLTVMFVVMGVTRAEAYYGFMDHYFGRGFGSYGYSYGYGYGYGYGRDRTLGRIIGYGGLTMDVLHGIDQISVNNRLVNNQISATNRMLSMDEKEQEFRHQQQSQKQVVYVVPAEQFPNGVKKLQEENKEQEKKIAELQRQFAKKDNEVVKLQKQLAKKIEENEKKVMTELGKNKKAWRIYLMKKQVEGKSHAEALKATLKELSDSNDTSGLDTCDSILKILEEANDCSK